MLARRVASALAAKRDAQRAARATTEAAAAAIIACWVPALTARARFLRTRWVPSLHTRLRLAGWMG
jgi:hypothetical protein